jgi:hypothetical protein
MKFGMYITAPEIPRLIFVSVVISMNFVHRLKLDEIYHLIVVKQHSVKTFLRQLRIFGRGIFSWVRVVSKDIVRLVIPRTSCLLITQCPGV